VRHLNNYSTTMHLTINEQARALKEAANMHRDDCVCTTCHPQMSEQRHAMEKKRPKAHKIERLIRAAAHEFDVTTTSIVDSRRGSPDAATARQVCMVLCLQIIAIHEVGRVFGNRTAEAVQTAKKSLQGKIDHQEGFAAKVERIAKTARLKA